ncbi:hypothetical protein [Bradyrhizobium sp. CCBAU 21359]|uniref:hypothetical protein n=1 Tax=Bradyrhizobium sp. CCBAU 21359 TaxID=1325080 RepID=UPI0023068318|nr:hypothetical protein [Bradyrhizobium sp. CCBAU 21359]
MVPVESAVDTEIKSIPTDRQHLMHILESAKPPPDLSLSGRLGRMIKKGRGALQRLAVEQPWRSI